MDEKEEVTLICEEGDDDDPENRYLNEIHCRVTLIEGK